jgi:hypothetical protein
MTIRLWLRAARNRVRFVMISNVSSANPRPRSPGWAAPYQRQNHLHHVRAVHTRKHQAVWVGAARPWVKFVNHGQARNVSVPLHPRNLGRPRRNPPSPVWISTAVARSYPRAARNRVRFVMTSNVSSANHRTRSPGWATRTVLERSPLRLFNTMVCFCLRAAG